MRKAHWAALAVALTWGALARASDPIGVYAVIDKVVLEPDGSKPERVRVWGAFMFAVPRGGDQYTPPARGYLYYRAVPGKEDVCRREWADFRKVAGTGQCLAFGSRYEEKGRLRRPAARVRPAAPVDKERLARLIADLNSDQFGVRDRAAAELEKLGPRAEPALRKVLQGKPSAEVRRRVEKLLEKDTPDDYPVGFGLTRVRRDADYGPVQQLRSLPAPVTPEDGGEVEPGKVKLVVRNLGGERREARYVFEIENGAGKKEVSPPVRPGEGKTSWSPKMEVKAGQTYTWRVRAVQESWEGPAAEMAFVGKPRS